MEKEKLNLEEQIKYLESQIDRLAECLTQYHADEIKDGESAIEMAIRLLKSN